MTLPKSLLLTMFYLLSSIQVHAEVPNCLSGYCLGDRIDKSSLEKWSIDNTIDRSCQSTRRYTLSADNFFLSAITNKITGVIYKLDRELALDPEKHSHTIAKWDKLVREKYGTPSIGMKVREEYTDATRNSTYTHTIWWKYSAKNEARGLPDSIQMRLNILFSSEGLSTVRFPGKILQQIGIIDLKANEELYLLEKKCSLESSLPD